MLLKGVMVLLLGMYVSSLPPSFLALIYSHLTTNSATGRSSTATNTATGSTADSQISASAKLKRLTKPGSDRSMLESPFRSLTT